MAGSHNINMSGQIIPVMNYGGSTRIGSIYPKERFVILEIWVANSMERTNCRIMFRNSAGQFVQGYIYNMGQENGNWAASWFDYGFWYADGINGYYCAALKTDRTCYLYNTGTGQLYGTIPANCWVYVDSDCQSGASNPDYMLIRGYNDGTYNGVTLFIDTQIDQNSTDTPVFGNW